MLEDEFSSIRFMTVLTPGTYLRKIIVVSTTCAKLDTKALPFNRRLTVSRFTYETAIAQVRAMNSHNIDFQNLEWKIDAESSRGYATLDEIKKIHEKVCDTQQFVDCEHIES